jgi:hypothetical protein
MKGFSIQIQQQPATMLMFEIESNNIRSNDDDVAEIVSVKIPR